MRDYPRAREDMIPLTNPFQLWDDCLLDGSELVHTKSGCGTKTTFSNSYRGVNAPRVGSSRHPYNYPSTALYS